MIHFCLCLIPFSYPPPSFLSPFLSLAQPIAILGPFFPPSPLLYTVPSISSPFVSLSNSSHIPFLSPLYARPILIPHPVICKQKIPPYPNRAALVLSERHGHQPRDPRPHFKIMYSLYRLHRNTTRGRTTWT